jgi:DNA/RNA endonuclease YhcR with UshA esterase domain
VKVDSIILTDTNGGTVTALSAPRTIELTHLSADSEPLALLNIPQGSYNKADIHILSAEVTFLDSTNQPKQQQFPVNSTVSVTLNPAVAVGANSTVLTIDVDVASSVSISGNTATLNTIVFSVTSTTVNANENEQEAEDGEMEDITGLVTAVNGTSFTLTLGQNGVQLTFTTDANTQFSDGVTSAASALNMIVKVEGVTKSDGTLYAKEVEGIENQNGAELEGFITAVTPGPPTAATSLTIVGQDGIGSGIDDTDIGATITVDVSGVSSSGYKVNLGNIDTSGLSGGIPGSNFPFDPTTIHAGQSVEVESASTQSGSTLTAEKVKLHQQTLKGTVSLLNGPTNAGPVQFALTVPVDSAFATASGQIAVIVFWQPGTDLHNLGSVSNGDTVRVRGLIFWTGSQFKMIARRISQ